MCGFTGFWQSEDALRAHGVDTSLDARTAFLERTGNAMAERIAHRGPDGHGVWCDAHYGIAFGHRRLSIVDVSSHGHQPMISPSGRYVIAFNGEVYNASRLRPGLEAKGYRFHGHSDTEIMLALIEDVGLDAAVSQFMGMFAFSLWDHKTQTLFLVRDRVGVKPLYYGVIGQGSAHNNPDDPTQGASSTLCFGSQVSSFYAHPDWQGHIHANAVREFIMYNYIPGEQSIYQGIRKVQPGTIVALRRDERGVLHHDVHAYWSLKDVYQKGLHTRVHDESGKDDSHYEKELHDILADSIQLRQVADVPLGAFLSGGIDSSLVVALMAKSSDRPVNTFTIGFEEDQFDESSYAHDVAKHLGTYHTCEILSHRDALDIIPDLPSFYDEPFADVSQIPTYLVSAIARKHVTVALSGDGGDEFFAGYTRHHAVQKLYHQFSGMSPAMCKRVGEPMLRLALSMMRLPSIGPKLTRMISRMAHVNNPTDKMQKLLDIIHTVAQHDKSIFGAERALLKQLFHGTYRIGRQGDIGEIFPSSPTTFDNIWDHGYMDGMVAVDHMQLCDALMYLNGDILTKVDRASMAHSLEAREPLLDHRVIEASCALPLRLKLNEQGEGKIILKRILGQYIPSSLINRPKQGFGVPISAWLKGPLRDWAFDLLHPLNLKGTLLEPGTDYIQHNLTQHTRGTADYGYALWGILMYQAWYDMHKVNLG